MVSRELKDSESGVKATVIAQDGIAVIVNPDAPSTSLRPIQVKGIYTGELTTWKMLFRRPNSRRKSSTLRGADAPRLGASR